MKKLAAIILATMLLLSSTALAAGAGEPVTITFWTANSDYDEHMTHLVEAFNASEASEGIEVEIEYFVDSATYLPALISGFSDGSAPDVFYMWGDLWVSYANEGLLADLSDTQYAQHMNGIGAGQVARDGKLISAVLGSSLFCVLYNQDIFDELNLKAPATWEELVQAAQACQAAGYGAIAYPGGDATHVWMSRAAMSALMGQNAASAFYEGMDAGQIVDLSAVEGLRDVLTSLSDYHPILHDNSDTMSQMSELTLFSSGECAMIINYTGRMINYEPMAEMNVGIAPMMFSAADEQTYYAEVNTALCVNGTAGAEKQAAAKAFIDFATNEENAGYWATNVGEIPGREGIVAGHKYGNLLNDEIAKYGAVAQPTYTTKNAEFWSNEWDNFLLGVIYGGDDVDVGLAEMSGILQSADIQSIAG